MPSIRMLIKGARGIKGTDNSGKSCDPYVKYTFGEQETEETKVIQKTLTPVWNHQDEFDNVQQLHWKLNCKIYDEDVGSDDIVGECDIPVDGLVPFKRTSAWYPLKPQGEIEVELTWCPDIWLNIIEARNLSGSTEMDPFVEAQASDVEPVKTKRKTDERNPIWRENFQIVCKNRDTCNIKFTVWDYERFGGNKEIGNTVVPASDIPLFTKYEKWVNVGNGDVHVEMWFHPIAEKARDAQLPAADKAAEEKKEAERMKAEEDLKKVAEEQDKRVQAAEAKKEAAVAASAQANAVTILSAVYGGGNCTNAVQALVNPNTKTLDWSGDMNTTFVQRDVPYLFIAYSAYGKSPLLAMFKNGDHVVLPRPNDANVTPAPVVTAGGLELFAAYMNEVLITEDIRRFINPAGAIISAARRYRYVKDLGTPALQVCTVLYRSNGVVKLFSGIENLNPINCR